MGMMGLMGERWWCAVLQSSVDGGKERSGSLEQQPAGAAG